MSLVIYAIWGAVVGLCIDEVYNHTWVTICWNNIDGGSLLLMCCCCCCFCCSFNCFIFIFFVFTDAVIVAVIVVAVVVTFVIVIFVVVVVVAADVVFVTEAVFVAVIVAVIVVAVVVTFVIVIFVVVFAADVVFVTDAVFVAVIVVIVVALPVVVRVELTQFSFISCQTDLTSSASTKARAPGSHVIIVGTHVDLLPSSGKEKRIHELNLTIAKRYNKKGFPIIKGYHMVSCTTGENMSELRQAIYQAALELKETENTGKGESLIGRKVSRVKHNNSSFSAWKIEVCFSV